MSVKVLNRPDRRYQALYETAISTGLTQRHYI
ncbi:MAG: hypothetical protein F6K23_30925 [Okeania sp. SIO2C9]|nr:hypothetical protein [Okeania sp. SIO2C9]